MKKIKSVKKLTNNRFLNLYQITYELKNGKEYNYFFASRRDLENVEVKKHKTDAVRILPYIKKDGKIYVVLIKEFRYAIGKYIYGTPAGLVDAGEASEIAARRELKEEIGADVVFIEKIQSAGYSSAGLSDETIECFNAEVKLSHKQSLEETEDINIQLVELDKLPKFLKTHEFGLQSALQLRAFYFEKKCNQTLER